MFIHDLTSFEVRMIEMDDASRFPPGRRQINWGELHAMAEVRFRTNARSNPHDLLLIHNLRIRSMLIVPLVLDLLHPTGNKAQL